MPSSFKFFIKSYGCQMNCYDSDMMADILISENFLKTTEISDAQILIFNTCSIREKADEKLFSDLGRAKQLKDRKNLTGKNVIIIVTGCVAQVFKEGIFARAPYVDIVLGPQDIHLVAKAIKDLLLSKKRPFISVLQRPADKFYDLPDVKLDRGVSAFLTIQEGCNNFCTYCIVPYSRGREFSRSYDEILDEAKRLVAFGVKEIILLGQNVNSYKSEKNGKLFSLADIICALADIDGLYRIRYTTSHPKDVSDDIISAHKEIAKLAPFLHLPVQSGSDEILFRMNRKYTSDEYMNCIEKIRSARPDIAISSDFIVGFPGESESDFEATLKLVRDVKFSQAYSFKYSKRPNTPGASMQDQIPDAVKSARLEVLQKLLDNSQQEFNKMTVDKFVQVLITKSGKHDGELSGRSEYSQAVAIKNTQDKDILIGDMVNVKITDTSSHGLIGEVV